jgi:gp16 family phage-associated protein
MKLDHSRSALDLASFEQVHSSSGQIVAPIFVEHFRATGMSIAEWARSKNFNPRLVYMVLRRERKCLRGASFKIAQELGMK